MASMSMSEIVVHDIEQAAQSFNNIDYADKVVAQSAQFNISNFQCFMIEEGDLLIAVGSWLINDSKQWDFIQAFRFDGDKIAETWLPSIGGNDDSLNLGEHSKWPAGVIPAPVYQPKP